MTTTVGEREQCKREREKGEKMSKTIYFKSDAYSEVNHSNNAHKFTVNIQKDLLLNYQQSGCGGRSSSDNPLIYVAVKSISFRLINRPESTQVLALQSDLKTDHTCFGSRYQSIVSSFLLRTHEEGREEEEHFVSRHYNPIFIPSSIQKLSTCSFSLCNLEDKTDTLSYIDKATPTIVEVWVKPRREPRGDSTMLPFHMFIKSSDIDSKKTYPQNIETDFNFKLAEHKHLSGKWVVLLRNLIVSRKFFNVPDDTSFYMEYKRYDYQSLSNQTNEITKFHGLHNSFHKRVNISAGYYGSEEAIVNHVNNLLVDISNKQLKLELNKKNVKKCRINMTNMKMREKRMHFLMMSEPLAIALGFTQEMKEMPMSQEKESHIRLDPKSNPSLVLAAESEMRIFHKQPKQVLLNCNIIEPSLFGSRMTPILHLIPINRSEGDDSHIIHISFPEHTYKDLIVNSFNHIKFWFEDEDGHLLRMDEGANSTYITLSFVKLT